MNETNIQNFALHHANDMTTKQESVTLTRLQNSEKLIRECLQSDAKKRDTSPINKWNQTERTLL